MEDVDFAKKLFATKELLMRYALYLTGDEESASDLFQETMIHAYMARDRVTDIGGLRHWLAVIMRNLHFNNIAKDKAAVDYAEYVTTVRLIDYETPEELLVVRDIRKYIENMPEVLRKPIELRLSGLSYLEICEVLNIPITTLKNRLFAAKKEIKKQMK